MTAIYYVARSRHREERKSGYVEDKTVIDMQRYKIFKALRTVMNAR